MILNLSDVLSEQHKTIEEDVLIEMERFGSKLGCFPIIEKEPLSIKAVSYTHLDVYKRQ